MPLQGLPLQSQPFFMPDAAPCLCKDFPYRANPFSCWIQCLAFARSSPIEPAIFHVGCSTLLLQGFPLQSQPFFMLDAVPCLCKDFHYRANPFSCWMQYLASARISTTEPVLFHTGCSTQHLYPTMGGLACHHVGKAQHLHLTIGGTNPTTTSERHSTYI